MRQDHHGADHSRKEGSLPGHAGFFRGLSEAENAAENTVDLAGDVEGQHGERTGRLVSLLGEAASALEDAGRDGAQVERTQEMEALHHNLEEAYIQTVLFLARAMEGRDAYTEGHGERLAALADRLARALDLPEEEVKNIRCAALLRDVGKIVAPDGVLRKPGPLTDQEWAIMRRHPVVGEEILRPVERMRGVAEIVRHHHEKWDGTGYPDGLREDMIPLGARILAVAVAYSAIIGARPYKAPKTPTEAESELTRCAGTQFDPRVVEAFMRIEILDPHTGGWKEQSKATKNRAHAVGLTA
jgi:HD-GYP domain-containing protein (c-di-GMP phosphodiesterase class II)